MIAQVKKLKREFIETLIEYYPDAEVSIVLGEPKVLRKLDIMLLNDIEDYIPNNFQILRDSSNSILQQLVSYIEYSDKHSEVSIMDMLFEVLEDNGIEYTGDIVDFLYNSDRVDIIEVREALESLAYLTFKYNW